MNIYVKNREEMISYTYSAASNPSNKRFAIISISSIEAEVPKFCQSSKLRKILYLRFNDVSNNIPNCMSEMDAVKIFKFVKEIKDFNINANESNSIDTIFVHGDAGVSRSAAVAAVLMKYFHGNDSEIFDNRRYIPNMHVYALLLNEFFNKDYKEEYYKEDKDIDEEDFYKEFKYTMADEKFREEVEYESAKIKDCISFKTLNRYIQANQFLIDYQRKEDSLYWFFNKISIFRIAAYKVYKETNNKELYNYFKYYLNPRFKALKKCIEFINETYFDNFGIYEKKKD